VSAQRPVPVADVADDLAAGTAYPARSPFKRYDHAAAVELFIARRDYWIAAAASYADLAALANAAGDTSGAGEAMTDARRCLDNADYYAPTTARTA
jgi:hypothetical protein